MVISALGLLRSNSYSLDNPILNVANEDVETSHKDLIEDENSMNHVNEIDERSLIAFVKNKMNEILSERELKIVNMRLYEEKTIQEIAEIYNLSRQRIQQIEMSAYEKVKKQC